MALKGTPNIDAAMREPEGRALVGQLLTALTATEREALKRYYRDLQSAAEIESTLQWVTGQMADLRRELRNRFFARLAVRKGETAVDQDVVME